MRDGTWGHNDATYLMTYISSFQIITLSTGFIAAPRLGLICFNPATGSSELADTRLPNPGNLTLKKLSGD